MCQNQVHSFAALCGSKICYSHCCGIVAHLYIKKNATGNNSFLDIRPVRHAILQDDWSQTLDLRQTPTTSQCIVKNSINVLCTCDITVCLHYLEENANLTGLYTQICINFHKHKADLRSWDVALYNESKLWWSVSSVFCEKWRLHLRWEEHSGYLPPVFMCKAFLLLCHDNERESSTVLYKYNNQK